MMPPDTPVADLHERLCCLACSAATEAGAFIREQLGNVAAADIEEKFRNGLVSYVDKTAESMLVEKLAPLLPGASFLTEEGTVDRSSSRWEWIVDPLDGTTNFLHGLPFFSVSIALQDAGRTVVGVVYEVNRDELFYAWQGGGAWLNGRRIRVSPATSLHASLVATGFPYHDYGRMGAYLGALGQLMQQTRGIRRLGSAALDLAYVACGRFEAFFEYRLQPWDIAGGAFLVEEAGGKVTDFRGRPGDGSGDELLAACPGVWSGMTGVLQNAFYPGP